MPSTFLKNVIEKQNKKRSQSNSLIFSFICTKMKVYQHHHEKILSDFYYFIQIQIETIGTKARNNSLILNILDSIITQKPSIEKVLYMPYKSHRIKYSIFPLLNITRQCLYDYQPIIIKLRIIDKINPSVCIFKLSEWIRILFLPIITIEINKSTHSIFFSTTDKQKERK
jgi:hypothetical protein